MIVADILAAFIVAPLFVGLAWLIVTMVTFRRRRKRMEQRRVYLALLYNADYQHKAYMQGDYTYGMYGDYPPVNLDGDHA